MSAAAKRARDVAAKVPQLISCLERRIDDDVPGSGKPPIGDVVAISSGWADSKQVAAGAVATTMNAHQQEQLFNMMSRHVAIQGMTFIPISRYTICALSQGRICDSPEIEGPRTVNSPKLGVITPGQPCETCGLTVEHCQGHFGRIDLPDPIPHPFFMVIAANVLQCICSSCGALLITGQSRTDVEKRFQGVSRIARFAKLVAEKQHTTKCHRDQKEYERLKNPEEYKWHHIPRRVTIPRGISWEFNYKSFPAKGKGGGAGGDEEVEGGKGGKSKDDGTSDGKISPIDALGLFNMITPEDLVSLGFVPDTITYRDRLRGNFGDSPFHPRNFIIQCISVLPLRDRPPAELNDTSKYDHLTILMSQIIRDCNKIQTSKNLQNGIIAEALDDVPTKLDVDILEEAGEADKEEMKKARAKLDHTQTKTEFITAAFEPSLKSKFSKGNQTYIDIIASVITRHYNDRKLNYGSEKRKISDHTERLVCRVTSLIQNVRKCRIDRRNTARGLGDRLTGKTGIYRGFGQAKRGSRCARTVLNPGETPLGVVMLPQLFRAVWIPERVHALNIDRIRLAAERGEVIFLTKFVSSSDDAPTTVDPHFGERMLYAKIVNLAVASQGAAAPASYAEYAQQLIQIGDIVERLPEPYDAVILNRQPSLWQYSMSSQCPVFDPRRNTIGMSMLLTKPFNADFDGDEGNGYFCSTVKSIVEAKLLMSPEANILTTSNCGSVTYKMTFNSPISAYLLSLDAERAAQADAAAERATVVSLTPSEWKEIERTLLVDSSRARTVDARLDEAGIRDWSRDLKRLISLAFPTNLYYKRSYKEDVIAPPPAAARPEDGPPGAAAAPATPAAAAKRLSEFVSAVFDKKPIPQQKKEVVIKHGVFVKGVLTAKDLDELTVLIYHRHGGHAAARFLKELPAILNWYIHRRGFSLTFDDCFVRPRRRAGAGAGGVDAIDIDDALRACTARIRANVDALKAERALNETGERMKDAEISVTLGQSELLGAYIVSSAVTGKESTLLNMIRSGAKGKESNAMQIGGSIGQQFLHGARPPKIIPGDRATVYAEAYSGALEDHGFVSSSFAMGCRPSEFFFHATSSRNGLIDTSVNTADVGTVNNRVQKSLENITIGYDGCASICDQAVVMLKYPWSISELVTVTECKATGPVDLPVNVFALCEELNSQDEMIDYVSRDDDSRASP